MVEKDISIRDDYIKLSDLLKFSNIVSQGSEAKYLILEGSVSVNGEVALQRGRKIYRGMKVNCLYDGNEYILNVK